MFKKMNKTIRVLIMTALMMVLFQVPVFAATGATSVRFEDNNMIFKVDDGTNLDKVVNRRTNPYYVYLDMDLQGIEFTDNVTLKLRCYDVDSGPEVDNVYVNGHLVGILTGANNSWSTVTLSVPAKYLKPDKNYIQIDVDCQLLGYYVIVDYVEIIAPIQIGEVSAISQNINWEQAEVMNKPLNAAASENQALIGKYNSKIPYSFVADCNPASHKDSIAPKIETTWTIYDATNNMVKFGTGTTDGWEGNVNITVPSEVGKYTLKVDSTIYATGEEWLFGEKDQKKMSVQTETYTLYSVLGKAGSYTTSDEQVIDCNDEKWIDLGAQMAQGSKSKNAVAENITKSLYENPYDWTFGYYEDGSKDDVLALFEGSGEKKTDSYVINDALNVLANAVGLTTLTTKVYNSTPYITKSEYTSLDGNKGANALEQDNSQANRWYITEHVYSKLGKRVFDPTFGLYKGTSENENVYAKVSGMSDEGEVLLKTLDGEQEFILEEQDTQVLGWPQVVLKPISSEIQDENE